MQKLHKNVSIILEMFLEGQLVEAVQFLEQACAPITPEWLDDSSTDVETSGVGIEASLLDINMKSFVSEAVSTGLINNTIFREMLSNSKINKNNFFEALAPRIAHLFETDFYEFKKLCQYADDFYNEPDNILKNRFQTTVCECVLADPENVTIKNINKLSSVIPLHDAMVYVKEGRPELNRCLVEAARFSECLPRADVVASKYDEDDPTIMLSTDDAEHLILSLIRKHDLENAVLALDSLLANEDLSRSNFSLARIMEIAPLWDHRQKSVHEDKQVNFHSLIASRASRILDIRCDFMVAEPFKGKKLSPTWRVANKYNALAGFEGLSLVDAQIIAPFHTATPDAKMLAWMIVGATNSTANGFTQLMNLEECTGKELDSEIVSRLFIRAAQNRKEDVKMSTYMEFLLLKDRDIKWIDHKDIFGHKPGFKMRESDYKDLSGLIDKYAGHDTYRPILLEALNSAILHSMAVVNYFPERPESMVRDLLIKIQEDVNPEHLRYCGAFRRAHITTNLEL